MVGGAPVVEHDASLWKRFPQIDSYWLYKAAEIHDLNAEAVQVLAFLAERATAASDD